MIRRLREVSERFRGACKTGPRKVLQLQRHARGLQDGHLKRAHNIGTPASPAGGETRARPEVFELERRAQLVMKSGRLCVSAAVLFGLLVSGTQQVRVLLIPRHSVVS